jgi:asparagine synthetase B (glutamine-hydrolysing)
VPGALLAVIGGEHPADAWARMAAVSPYRGAPQLLATPGLALGIQSVDPSRQWYDSPTLALAVQGYVQFADRPIGDYAARDIAERWLASGDALWSALRGEFSIVLWRKSDRALDIIRDPLNGRPLHYTRDRDQLLIATEIRQLRAVRRDRLALDRSAIESLAHTYAFPEPTTPWREVLRFPSAQRTTVQFSGAIGHQPIPTALDRFDADLARAEPAEQLEEAARRVEQAVRRTLGNGLHHVQLSGGLDSRLVFGIARRAAPDRVEAISQRFAGFDCDESDIIRGVHQALGSTAQFHDYVPDAFAATFAELLARCDYPVFLTSHFTAQLLADSARAGASIVLGGFGGDELFLAQPRALLDVPLAERWRHRAALAGYWKSLPTRKLRAALAMAVPERIRSFARRLRHSASSQELARRRWHVLKRKHSAHGFYGMLEQLPASYGLDLRMPFRDVDLAAWAQSVHPLGLMRGADPRGLEIALLERWVSLPVSLTCREKVNYTQIVELAVRSWPECNSQPYRMDSAMKALVARFVAFHTSNS